MIDINKLIQGKNLTEIEVHVLKYIIKNIDTVLQKGVREIAKENYTSPSTVIRLSKKLGYTGFVDMYYQLVPELKNIENRQSVSDDFPEIRTADFLNTITSKKLNSLLIKS